MSRRHRKPSCQSTRAALVNIQTRSDNKRETFFEARKSGLATKKKYFFGEVFFIHAVVPKVLVFDGNSEVSAHVRSNFFYLNCLDREQSQIVFFSLKRPTFLHACTTCSKLPSNISTMVDSKEYSYYSRITRIFILSSTEKQKTH